MTAARTTTPYGWVANIQRFCSDDGPGIRTTVFLKGCPLRCAWCHNPETQLLLPQISFDIDRCLLCAACVRACDHDAFTLDAPYPDRNKCVNCGECVEACPTGARKFIGDRYSVDELYELLAKDGAFFSESAGGVTFSGGEPLSQPEFLVAMLERCKQHAIHTTLDTCGFAKWEDLERAAKLCDLVLYDVKGIDPERHREMTGQTNERILDNLSRLASTEVPIWIRVPLIPGHNDDEVSLRSLAEFVNGLPRHCPVWLLPYHKLGSHKASLLGYQDPKGFPEPDPAYVSACADLLCSMGLEVHVNHVK